MLSYFPDPLLTYPRRESSASLFRHPGIQLIDTSVMFSSLQPYTYLIYRRLVFSVSPLAIRSWKFPLYLNK